MNVFRSLDEASGRFAPCALTIGNFDGCHLGHQSIFRHAVQWAEQRGMEPSVLTFHPHPAAVVAPTRAPKLLSTLDQRGQWMAACGIRQVLILPFDREIASLTPERFAELILAQTLRTRLVLVGDNFRFGNRQAGDIATLTRLGSALGFETMPVTAVTCRGVIVSSTEIRRRILDGRMAQAARLLGRFYFLEGDVVSGHGIGSRQTVPTLNLSTTAEVLPANGVYVTRTTCLRSGRAWPSVTNIGIRPTFEGSALTVETFLLDPLDGVTPAQIRVEFTHRLREERKFATPDLLKAQILADAARARSWHRRWTSRSRYTGKSLA